MGWNIAIPVKNASDGVANTEFNALAQPLTAPTAPTIGFNSGQTGTLALVSATSVAEPNCVTYRLYYTFTPGAISNFTAFQVNGAPAGYTLKLADASYIDDITGIPRSIGLNPLNNLFYTNNASTNLHRLLVQLEYFKN